ncbi:efflux RND transporter permease subunit [Paenibacillus tyrfis]|uniref:efflux RND transporter permease subunit n=1 Tax=Paenibacillus tyrfis TaxID=1501230 RepID=UPI00209D92E4|nr:efflux RND transporter permease subunit [Paenibacillus tyrfis]MCP1311718.1 efflux RND transporter permease subunit [Paenibacillus tyrfis]
MSGWTNFSMKYVSAVFIILVLLVGGGTYAGTSLKMESLPNISFPIVVVQTRYPAPPKDVLDQVTKPIEKELANVEGLKGMTSTSSDNVSSIVIEFAQGRNIKEAKRDVESLLQNVSLPQGAERPKAMTTGFANDPVYYMAIYGENGMSQAELDREYEDTILPAFNALKGIDHVASIGNHQAQLNIKLDAKALLASGLTPQEVGQSIKDALKSSPAGNVKINGQSKMVRVSGDINSVYNLEKLNVTTPKGDVLPLGRLATVESVSESKFIARLDGRPTIAVHLYKAKNANAVQFAEGADKLMEGWQKTLPNVKFHTVYNAAVDIKLSIEGMLKEGAIGALLASVMILFFLRNVRMTLIVLVSIPLSIFITLLVMAPLGITLNIMTLGGIAISIGRVVDDSIVVIENIYSQLVQRQERNEDVIKYATKQVATAITSSTITTVGVFGPIALVTDTLGEIFRPFAITIVVALLASLLVSVTVIPMLAKLTVLKQKHIGSAHHGTGRMSEWYRSSLAWSLRNRIKTLILTVMIFVVSIVTTVPFLGASFMPESAADKLIMIDVKMPPETSFETLDIQMKQIETAMSEAKNADGGKTFTYVEALIGYYLNADERTANRAMFFLRAEEATDAKAAVKEWKERIAYELPQKSVVDGTVLAFGPPTTGQDFVYNLKGEDQIYLEKAAEEIKEKLKTYPELTDIKDSLGEKKEEVEIAVDQDKARKYGLSSAQVLGMAAGWIGVDNLGEFRFNNEIFKTTIELNEKDKDAIDKIGRFILKTPAGPDIALQDVAKVRLIDAPASIQRDMQKQTVTITAKVDVKDKAGVISKVTKDLSAIALPPGVIHEVKGISEDIEESFMQLFLAMVASILIVYLIMVISFGNASAPFAILFSLPLALIGGFYGLLVTKETINVTSLIGFLMLIGIVVTNAIVLIDRVQQLRGEGHEIREALLEAGATRLRPIIMTAGATMLALLPLGLGFSKGAIMSKGLAVVVIGGLATSTLLTLVVVPVVYDIIESLKLRMSRPFRKKETATLQAKGTTSVPR